MDVSIENDSDKEPTLGNIIEKCKLDTDRWEVVDFSVSLSDGDKWWAKLSCKPKLSELDYEDIAKRIQTYHDTHDLTSVTNRALTDKVLEVGIYDVHFGLPLNDFVLNELFYWVRDIILKVSPKLVVLPLAGDIFHFDNKSQRTSKGTFVGEDSYNLSWHDNVSSSYVRICSFIESISYFSDVRVLVLPGNHDEHTAFGLGQFLAAFFRHSNHISVDDSKSVYKYVSAGSTLIGYTHGDSYSSKVSLAALMANDVPEMWAQSKFREVHHGHFHKEEVTEDTGVIVRSMPALSRLSDWERNSGYRRRPRMQLYEYDVENGLVGIYPIWVD